ncbi:MAG: hypothetical protein WAQ52_08720 [Terriglobales bacterium]
MSESTEQQTVPEIQQAFQLFLDIRPDAQVSVEDARRMADYVIDAGLDPFKAGSYWRAYQWVKSEPQRQADEEAVRAAQEAERLAERQNYLRPSAEDRRALLQSLKQNQPSARPEFTPEREYTDAEIEAMTSSEFRQKVLGVRTIEEQQGSTSTTSTPPEQYVYRAPRKAKVVTALDRAMRTALLERKSR